MTAPGQVYGFGPFRLDPVSFRLLRDGQPLPLAPKALDLLLHLVQRPEALVSKEEILNALWPGVAVTDNAITQVVSDLRQALGDNPAAPLYIQTVARRGYRFIAAIERIAPAAAAPASGSGGAPEAPAAARVGVRETSSADAYRSFTEGRLKLESMDLARVPSAINDFERAIAVDGRYALPHVGLAHARFWLFEASRARNRPDKDQLAAAIVDARRAIDLDPDLAEAHAALALMLTSAGKTEEAVSAGRRAVVLEPGNWRNHCRLGVAAWGAERLAAVERVLALYPAFAYAYYGIAMVHVARGHLADAAHALRQGIPFQDMPDGRADRFPARGLHWLLGLIALAEGDVAGSRAEFDRELSSGTGGVYDREFAANAYEGHGFALLVEKRTGEAASMFERALGEYPDHVRSLLGLAACAQLAGAADRARTLERAGSAIGELESAGRTVEAQMAHAMAHMIGNAPLKALESLERLVASAPHGFAGWTIPIEPLFAPLAAAPSFTALKARLAERAQ
ncbi:MAG TPA: winged helix-turn-helix domain-containing protein [Vicinamibacterales bacterium]|nr:winged helix-turn-helix domain-containing protein [Vicinamibacterales bacterium]